MRGEGIWIAPSGKYIDASISHIDTVVKNPNIFGITKDEINKVYDKYGEKYYMEGKAREEIIIDLLKKGFIRIRAYPNRNYTVNVDSMQDKVKRLITNWASDLAYSDTGVLNNVEKDVFMPVNIVPMTGKGDSLTVKKIALGELTGNVFEFKRIFRYNIRNIKNKLLKYLT